MKKEHILVPEPNSKFLKINCKECEKENIVYSHASTPVTCKSCGNVIAEPTGAKARIMGKISGTVDGPTDDGGKSSKKDTITVN